MSSRREPRLEEVAGRLDVPENDPVEIRAGRLPPRIFLSPADIELIGRAESRGDGLVRFGSRATPRAQEPQPAGPGLAIDDQPGRRQGIDRKR